MYVVISVVGIVLCVIRKLVLLRGKLNDCMHVKMYGKVAYMKVWEFTEDDDLGRIDSGNRIYTKGHAQISRYWGCM